MANVLFTRTSDPSSKPITDGQLIFDTSGNGKMYLDVGDKRLEMGGAINIDSTLDPTSENPIQNKAVAGVMLSTLEEIDKVTSKGKLTDALATKELNTKVTDLETDVSSLTDDYISKGKILKSLEEVTATTNAGFVPDALAIKELDTDLQGQIDTLNSDLNDIEYGSFEEFAGWNFSTSNYICKKNGFVIINFAVQAINPLVTGTWTSCKISSENFRPRKNISFTGNAHNQGSTRVPVTFTIYTNGNITFEIGNNNLSSVVDWFVFSGIYVV